MTNYYLIGNGNIMKSADWKFDENCLETEEEIVRCDERLMLKSNYDNYILTDEYNTKITVQENTIKKADLQLQIDELDKKSIRALREGGTMTDGMTYLEYYTAQIVALRAEIAAL